MKYIIKIPKPCNENWTEMIPTEKGRYCAVCKKEIYDFTDLSNRELVNKLENNENICAKYRKSQLNTDLFSNKNTGISKVGLLISITSVISLSQQSYGQIDSTNPKIETRTDLTDINEESKENSKIDSITVKGIVRDENGPVPGAYVLQKGFNTGTETDFDGKFEINVYRENEHDKIILEIGYIGYENKEIEIENINRTTEVEIINLEPSEIQLMGEVVIIKRNIFQRIGDLFRRKK